MISSSSADTRILAGPQATDNAAGNACIMELARVFQQHRDKLRRGLVCGFWTGHETGTMIGSSWFVDRNSDRLRKHAVAYLQIDQPSLCRHDTLERALPTPSCGVSTRA